MKGTSRMYDHESIAAVAEERLAEGASVTQIAREVGCSVSVAASVVRARPDLYALLKRKPHADDRMMRNMGVKMGNVSPALKRQPEDFRVWAISEAAEAGVSVADFIMSCAVDAFHEENAQCAI